VGIWLVFLVLFILALGSVVAIVVGALLGVFLGSLIGGIKGGWMAPQDRKELATYKGLAWGGCSGAVVGLALALLLVLLVWSCLISE
jgi:hypothetical protein